MRSDIRLRYLYESARLGTMRAASEQLDVATSSVSRQIGELEKELGIILIERGRRGIKLTEAGEAAYEFFRENCAHEEAFLSKIAELRSIRAGKIVLAAGEAFITDSFSELLQAFMQNYDGVSVHVRMSGSNDVVALVREDEAHFGLIFDVPRDPKVRARISIGQPLRFVASPGHEICGIRRPKLADLAQYSIGLPEDSFRIRQVVHHAEQDEGVFLEPALVTNSMTLLKVFVKCGRGVTILPEFLAQPDLSEGKLTAIPAHNRILNGTQISLITRAGRQLPVGVYRLMVRIEAFLKQSIAGPR